MDTLFDIGLSNAVAATLLALVAAVVGLFCKRPAVAHGLWALVLLKLITPPLFAVPILVAPAPAPVAEVVPAAATPPVQKQAPLWTEPRPQAQPPVHSSTPTNTAAVPTPAATTTPLPEAAPAPAPSAAQPLAQPDEPAPRAEATVFDWRLLVLALWLGGAVLWWSLAAVRVARFQRLLRLADPVPEGERQRVRRWADRLGVRRCPELYFVDATVPPLLWALGWPPCLLLPRSLWQRLSTEQQDTLLLHELAHLRRRDHWVRRLELVVLGLYWWHPVVWLARHQIQEAEEQCCDEWVVWAAPALAATYASTLVETVAFLSPACAVVPPGASGSRRTRHIKRRLLMICQGTSRRRWSAAAVALLLPAALSLPLGLTVAQTPAGGPEAPTVRPGQAEVPPTTRPATDTKPAINKTATRPAQQETSPEAPVRDPRAGGQKPFGEANLTRQPAPAPDIAQKWKDLQDQVDLIKADVAIKQAELEAARVTYDLASQKFKRIEELHKRGVISAEEFLNAKGDVTIKFAGVRIKEAELQAVQVRLRQVMALTAQLQQLADDYGKRLPRTKPGVPGTTIPETKPGVPGKARDQRLDELEKKLDRLQKQLDLLQATLQPRKKASSFGGPRSPARLYKNKKEAITVPIEESLSGGGPGGTGVAEVKEYRFYVSIDGGGSWNLVATAPGKQKAFEFQPPNDGEYLCRIEGRNKAGALVYSSSGPRLVLDTMPPVIQLQGQRRGPEVAIHWHITDNNLDRTSVRLEYMNSRDKSWQRLLLSSSQDYGDTVFRPENADPITVRMTARDLAGHESRREIIVPEAGIAKKE